MSDLDPPGAIRVLTDQLKAMDAEALLLARWIARSHPGVNIPIDLPSVVFDVLSAAAGSVEARLWVPAELRHIVD